MKNNFINITCSIAFDRRLAVNLSLVNETTSSSLSLMRSWSQPAIYFFYCITF